MLLVDPTLRFESVIAWRSDPGPASLVLVTTNVNAPAATLVLAATAALGLPFEPVVSRSGEAPPQREMANSAQQVANVRGEFAVTHGPPPQPCLLVDDIRFSGWTLAMVAGQLRRRGSGPVYPLALTSAF